MKDSETAIAMVLVETGSDYETKSNNGLSHFLEHMCFKATKNRSGEEIRYELDSLGSDSNAFTGNEYTGYYAKTSHTKIDKILDVVSDIYLNPTFPEKDIEIEKGVIIEEINMYEDLPQRKVWDIWMKLLYGNQPAGQTIIGPKENIQKIKQIDFKKYHSEHYVPAKTVIIVAGKINEEKIIKAVEEKFATLPKGKISKKVKTIDEQKTSQIKIFEKKSDQTHLVLGFRAFDLYDKRNRALSLASVILGKGFSSRLFVKMRDELGMCYYTRAEIDSFTDHGFFAVSAGVNNARFEEAVQVIMEEFRKIRDIDISEKELKKAKDFALGKLATGLETSDAWAMFYGFQELHHEKIETPEEVAEKISKITAKDIKKVLAEIFNIKNLSLAVVGPQKVTPSLKKLLKI
jgi:predicted Zn-dependent peptidase